MGKIPVFMGPHRHEAEDIRLDNDLASVLKLPAGSTVADALLKSYLTGAGNGLLRATVLLPNGAPASNMRFTLSDATNQTITTDGNGKFSAYVSRSSVGIASPNCIDLMGAISVSTPIGAITETVLRFPKLGDPRRKFIVSTNDLTFSPAVASVDVFCVGGGGGGGNHGGGGGGYTKTALNLPIRANPENLVVGPGGSPGSGNGAIDGGDGGATSFYGVVAPGGKGGSSSTFRAGDGGSGGGGSGSPPGVGGSDGTNGVSGVFYPNAPNGAGGRGQGTTTREFGEASGALYAGGGGGYMYNALPAAAGGAGGGGYGGGFNPPSALGGNGTGGTGGGGGAQTGHGGSGVVVVRWRYK